VSYRFALEPKWLLSHLLVLVLVITMVNLGLWQLRRHDERAERNDLIELRADAEPVPLDQALATADDPGDLQFVRVSASGVYDDSTSVLVANRTFEGSPGFWVMTPLVRETGAPLWVARGFVGRGVVGEQGDAVLAAPRGSIEVVGLLQVSADGGAFAGGDQLATVNRPDTAELAGSEGASEGADLGVYLQAEGDPSPLLTPVPPPPLDSGPHRSYAAQWFIFSLIAMIGYPLILRRVARDRATHERQRAAGTLTPDDVLV